MHADGSRRQWWQQCRLLPSLLGAVCFLYASAEGLAHDLFSSFIQHRVSILLGARYLDVTIQLTFFEDGSEQERGHMDRNTNGTVSRLEMDEYLENLENTWRNAVTLQMDHRRVALTSLCAPELDLLGNLSVGRGHHILTLRYFAPAPPRLPYNARVIVEDRLWPTFPALGAVQAEGRDNCQLAPVPLQDPVFPPALDGKPRVFEASVVVPSSPRHLHSSSHLNESP